MLVNARTKQKTFESHPQCNMPVNSSRRRNKLPLPLINLNLTRISRHPRTTPRPTTSPRLHIIPKFLLFKLHSL